jgi:hypothetical protein
MKAETIAEDVLPAFIEAFENMVKCDFNSEVHRALALFVTYAFHTPSASRPRTPKPASSSISGPSTPGSSLLRPPRSDVAVPGTGSQPSYLTKRRLGKIILVMFSKLLCERGNVGNIKRFARTVTNKVRYTERTRCLL